MTDANAWLPLNATERRALALDCIARMYNGLKDIDGSEIDIHDLFIESADAVWSSETATGDAMFLPGHFKSHFEVARRPEGNIFFAGEHLSRHHTWIAGALESTLEAVRGVLEQPTLQPLRGPAPTHVFASPKVGLSEKIQHKERPILSQIKTRRMSLPVSPAAVRVGRRFSTAQKWSLHSPVKHHPSMVAI
jgi:hypothetical protein